MVDAPEAQTAVEHAREDARIRADLVKIKQVVNLVHKDFDGFQYVIGRVDDRGRAHEFVDVKNLEDERQQHRNKVRDEFERNHENFENCHDDGSDDDSSRKKGDRYRKSSLVIAMPCDELDADDEILKDEDGEGRVFYRHGLGEEQLHLEDMLDDGIAEECARDEHENFENDGGNRDALVAREFVFSHNQHQGPFPVYTNG